MRLAVFIDAFPELPHRRGPRSTMASQEGGVR